jgi:hypothetical protein
MRNRAHLRYKEIMSFARCMAFAMLAAAPFAAVAQDNSPPRTPADPSDPAVAAAPPAYESVFRDYLKAAEQDELPATAWREANDNAGRLGGHAGQAKASAETAIFVTPATPATPAAAAPASAPAPDNHGHHRGMHRDSKGNS